MALQTGPGNRLLAALPPADLNLLEPHVQKIAFESDAVLVRTGDELKQVYFPVSGVLAFLVGCRTDTLSLPLSWARKERSALSPF